MPYFLCLSVACSQEPRQNPAASRPSGLRLVNAFPAQAAFDRPVYLDWHASDPAHYYLVEQPGRVLRIPRDGAKTERAVFLDWRKQTYTQHNEEGLLGFAFDPAYAENGWFYVYYSHGLPGDKRESVISRFSAKDHAADPASELVLLRIAQPWGNHNGGTIVFGPDRMLYIGMGDGGAAGDPLQSGQDKKSLLGKILRIDVQGASADLPYRIPKDNPFAKDPAWAPEVWALGIRNPWRITFDRKTGDLWCGDVGQDRFEEVDKIVKGGNYGWNFYEAAHTFPPGSMRDPNIGHIPPIAEYPRSEGQSVTGGYVYRGEKIAALQGAFVYGDYVSGKLWCVREKEGAQTQTGTLLLQTGKAIASFAEEPDGELLLLCFDGKVYRLSG